MRKLCPGDIIPVSVPKCAAGVERVFLRREGYANVEVGYVVRNAKDPKTASMDTDVSVGPIDPETQPGIWKLIVKTFCGCYALPVQLVCRGPEIPAYMLDSNVRTPTEVCCDKTSTD